MDILLAASADARHVDKLKVRALVQAPLKVLIISCRGLGPLVPGNHQLGSVCLADILYCLDFLQRLNPILLESSPSSGRYLANFYRVIRFYQVLCDKEIQKLALNPNYSVFLSQRNRKKGLKNWEEIFDAII